MSFRLHLDEDKIHHLDTLKPVCVNPEMSVRDVIAEMQNSKRGSALICRDGAPIGIFTERDALRMMASQADFDTPIESCMTPEPKTITAETTVEEAIQIMSEGGYRRLPVVNESGELVSMLKVSNILRYLVEHFPEYVYNLPPAPHHTMTEREGA